CNEGKQALVWGPSGADTPFASAQGRLCPAPLKLICAIERLVWGQLRGHDFQSCRSIVLEFPSARLEAVPSRPRESQSSGTSSDHRPHGSLYSNRNIPVFRQTWKTSENSFCIRALCSGFVARFPL